MASTPVQVQLPAGLTATLSLYADGSDTLANSPADSLTEESNRLGLYEATVTEALAGVYFAKVLVGANVIASGWVTLADDTTTYHVVDAYADASDLTAAAVRAEMDSNSTQLAAIVADTNELQSDDIPGTLAAMDTKIDTVDANIDTLLARITSTLFGGITSLAEWLGMIAGKQTGDSTARTEVRASGAGSGTYDETTDSLEAISDGAAGLTQQQVADALKLAPTAGSPAAGSQNADLDTLISRTSAGVTVTASGTADTDGNLTPPIIRGDSYNTAAGNAFTVTSSGFPAAVWDAVVTGTLKIKQGTTYTTTGTVVVTHDSDETITGTISLTSVETTALVADTGTTYELELTVGSDQRTISGKWHVLGSDE